MGMVELHDPAALPALLARGAWVPVDRRHGVTPERQGGPEVEARRAGSDHRYAHVLSFIPPRAGALAVLPDASTASMGQENETMKAGHADRTSPIGH
jgi:hypothetical protein